MASRITARDVDVLASAPTELCGASYERSTLIIQNLGPNAIYIGPSDVATTTGVQIAANGSITSADPAIGEKIYAIAATADQSGATNTRVLEVFGN